MERRHASLAVRIGKRRPFASLEQEAYLNLLRTHSVLTAPFDRLLRAHGISQPLYNILRILRGHAERCAGGRVGPAGVPVLRIGQEMVTREPDVTRLVNRLEQAGLAVRARCQADRRVVYVCITNLGVALLDRIGPEIEAIHRAQFQGLSREELRALNDLLFKAIEGGGRAH